MMKALKIFLAAAAVLTASSVMAQSRSCKLTVSVTSAEGDNLAGQPIVLTQTDYQVGYGSLQLDADGRCTLSVYPGNHLLEVERDGFVKGEKSFSIAADAKTAEVTLALAEETRDPYALKAQTEHISLTGENRVDLSWNKEDPAFFDDFEGHDAFAVQFGDWTGIDGDEESAAALTGIYPNRGSLQYAQIINPLTVYPTWWYDYPVLRPYSGQQYVGFTRTNSGNANDDWLISPEVTVGIENVVTFMAKAADRYNERFMVYITEKTDNPTVDDFVRIDPGNYESVDYKSWKRMSYSLADYSGKKVKIAIRYINSANLYGAFMLMVDDFYVGQEVAEEAVKAARRVNRSAANPNERFRVYLDGTLAGETDEPSYHFDNVAPGSHTLGVQAIYLAGESGISTMTLDVPEGPFAKVSVSVSADSYLEADKVELSFLNMETGRAESAVTSGGSLEIASLPTGKYTFNIAKGAYKEYNEEIEVTGDRELVIELEDDILDPYNISADADGENNVLLRWNQELLFSDGFESYDDFATGSFGDWRSIDVDGQPVYPIGLLSPDNIVSFPGSGNATNPTAIAPMVFNPWNTVPAMLPTDQAIAAFEGEKSVIFFSSQRTQSDKWLISPLVDVREGYSLSLKAKAYDGMYQETMHFCVSDGGAAPSDFTALETADAVPADNWVEYRVSLKDYEGRKIRIGLHYTSYDAFLMQVDDFTVGPEDGHGAFIDYGNVMHYDIYLDGEKAGESTAPQFTLENVAPGRHTVGIVAVYKNGSSQMAEYTFGESGVGEIAVEEECPSQAFDLLGRPAVAGGKGIVIVRKGDRFVKRISK